MRRGIWQLGCAIVGLGLAAGWWLSQRPAMERRAPERAADAAPRSADEHDASVPRSLARKRADDVRERLIRLRLASTDSARDSGLTAVIASPHPSRALAQPVSAASSVPSAPREPTPGLAIPTSNEAQHAYIRRVVHEQFIPMAGSCYEELLARDPRASGRLDLHVLIGGNAAVGGVVESAEVMPGSSLRDDALESCLLNSMLAVQFDPPPVENGRIDFVYPFQLSPDPAEAGPDR